MKLLCCFLILFGHSLYAFENNKFALGAAYYSQNIFNAVSTADSGNTGLLGETSYPLNLRYETALKSLGNWYFAPQLSYTVLPPPKGGGLTLLILILCLPLLVAVRFTNRFKQLK